ncbi:MAG TPA: hypothetical protein VFX17_03645, partial [Patescibacteria group bacterium]|nr:hypothetical protein [Patescibacteria group bacterium]
MESENPEKIGGLEPVQHFEQPEKPQESKPQESESVLPKAPGYQTDKEPSQTDADLSHPENIEPEQPNPEVQSQINTTDITSPYHRVEAPGSEGGFLSLAQAAELTGYHQDYLGQLARAGKLPAQKIGRNWVTTIEAVYKLKEGQDPSIGSNMVSDAVEEITEAPAPAKPEITPEALDQIKVQLDAVQSKMKAHDEKIDEQKIKIEKQREKILEHEEKFAPKEIPQNDHARVQSLNLRIAHHRPKDFIQHEVFDPASALPAGFSRHSIHTPKLAIAFLLLCGSFALASGALYLEHDTALPDSKNLVINYLPRNFANEGRIAAATQTQSQPSMITQIIYKIINLGNGSKGDKGDKGDIGPVGPIGPAGPVGPAGAPGTSVSYVLPTSPGSTPGSIAGFTYLSSKDFITDTAKVTTLTFADGTSMSTAAISASNFDTDITLNGQSDLRFADADSSNWVAFQAPSVVGANVTWTLPAADSAGCLQSDGAGNLSFGSCGGGSGALSGLSAAVATNTLNNGNNSQIWNWNLNTDKAAFIFGENAASTGGTGSQYILQAASLAGSTATPLDVKNFGDANSFEVDDEAADPTPFIIDASGNVTAGGTFNGATISGGTLSGGAVSGGTLTAAAVNGVTTSDIIQSTGSYADPSWVTSLSGAKITGNISGNAANVTGTIVVGNGGTGTNSFTVNGVLYGNGSNAVQSTAAGTDGQLLLGATSAAPHFVALSGDAALSNTGVLTIGVGKVTSSNILDGTVANNDLTNSSITVNTSSPLGGGGAVSLGGALTLTCTTCLTIESDTLSSVTARGNTTSSGISLTENGNTSTSYGLYLKRNTDTSPAGFLIQAQNNAANTNLFTVDTAGNITSGTVNGSTLTGGSLSSTQVNGVTTSDIVLSTGSYADPSWITSLAGSKISGDISGNAANVTGTVAVGNGGTGVGTFGGNNTLLYTTAADTLASLVTGNNGVLVTNGSGVPSIAATLPNAVEDNITRFGVIASGSFANAALKVADTDASNTLAIVPGSDLTLDRTLTVITGDASRTITLNGNPTLNDWFDQSVKSSDSPTFTDATLSSLAGGGTQCLEVDNTGTVHVTGSTCGTGGGGISSLTLAGSSGTPQTLTDGDTITIAAGAGVTAIAGATDTVTIASTLGTSVDLTSEVTGALPLANGGTGANLSDPGADTLFGFDNTDSSTVFFTIGSNLSYDHATHTLSATGGGGMTSFSVAGSSGTPQTITDTNTLTIGAGTGITTTAGATDTVTVAIDSTVATLTGSQTLTNKTLSGSSN